MEIVLEMFYMFQKQYDNLNNFYVLGDFNTAEDDKIFNCLTEAKSFKFNSLRDVSP